MNQGSKPASYRVGIDENGLGPRLGPLVVTGVLARTEGDGVKRAESRPRGKLAERLGDSKKLVAFGQSALGEAWARALLRRRGVAPASPDALLHAICLDPSTELRRLCPTAHVPQCWATDGEGFEADDALVTELGRDLERLAGKGVDVLDARVVIVCSRRLNDAVDAGLTRFDVDLHAMERLTLAARERAGADVVATCGKVGGFDRYAPHFGPLGGRLHVALEEGRARSEYSFPGVGRIAFVRDADDRHLLVCLASLVGKWARDFLMTRIVRHHRAGDPSLPLASGYHDPVTTRFIAATALARKERGLPDACFERRAVYSRGET